MTSDSSEMLDGGLVELCERYRDGYQRRDVEQMMDLFADDAEVVWSAGAFRGREAIRKVLEWDFGLSPTATVSDSGIGILTSGRTIVWERVVDLTADGIPYQEHAVMVIEVGEDGLIRSVRSYYDKLAILHEIASAYPGLQGRVFRALTGALTRLSSKGLDAVPG